MDWIFVGKGNSLTQIEISDFSQAVPAKYEYALALIAYSRMGGTAVAGSGSSGSGGSGSSKSSGSGSGGSKLPTA